MNVAMMDELAYQEQEGAGEAAWAAPTTARFPTTIQRCASPVPPGGRVGNHKRFFEEGDVLVAFGVVSALSCSKGPPPKTESAFGVVGVLSGSKGRLPSASARVLWGSEDGDVVAMEAEAVEAVAMEAEAMEAEEAMELGEAEVEAADLLDVIGSMRAPPSASDRIDAQMQDAEVVLGGVEAAASVVEAVAAIAPESAAIAEAPAEAGAIPPIAGDPLEELAIQAATAASLADGIRGSQAPELLAELQALRDRVKEQEELAIQAAIAASLADAIRGSQASELVAELQALRDRNKELEKEASMSRPLQDPRARLAHHHGLRGFEIEDVPGDNNFAAMPENSPEVEAAEAEAETESMEAETLSMEAAAPATAPVVEAAEVEAEAFAESPALEAEAVAEAVAEAFPLGEAVPEPEAALSAAPSGAETLRAKARQAAKDTAAAMLLWTRMLSAIVLQAAAADKVAAMKVAELRELLDLRGLGTGGKKAALAERLLAALVAEVVAVPAEEPAEEEEEPTAAAETAAAEAAAAEAAASMEGPRPLTADEVRALAELEGLELVRSSRNRTGFKGVFLKRGKYQSEVKENGKLRYLGSFATPEEASLHYARRVGAERAVAEASEARNADQHPPLTADEAKAAAAAEGLALVPSSSSETGFKGVRNSHGKYRVQIRENGSIRYFGTFTTPEEAALHYARRVGAERAVAEASEARNADQHPPLTADEAKAAAAANGLELVLSSRSETGFKGVTKNGDKYQVMIRENGSKRYLGTFVTPEEAALRYARHIGLVRAAIEAAEARGEGPLKGPQPLAADEARESVATEALALVPSSSMEGPSRLLEADKVRAAEPRSNAPGKARAPPVRPSYDSSDDEEGAPRRHDVREQEELLIAFNATVGCETSYDELHRSAASHEAGIDYGENAADIAAANMTDHVAATAENLHAPAGAAATAAAAAAQDGGAMLLWNKVAAMKVAELRESLTRRGLDKRGRTGALAERLLTALAAEAVAVPAEEEEEEPTVAEAVAAEAPAAEASAAETAAAETAASMEGPRPLTAVEARAAAQTEGLELVLSPSNQTGFKCVSKRWGRHQVMIRENGSKRSLGTFVTPEEAALCYARHIGPVRAVIEAAEVRIAAPQPLTAAEARAAAATEGLALVLSNNQTGFKGVSNKLGKYTAQIQWNGSVRYLGIYATPEEAALRYARHIGPVRAAIEAAEVRLRREMRIAAPQPLTAAEARAAAVVEGLELVLSSRSETGFKGVCKSRCNKYCVQIHEEDATRRLGIFATQEEAALCYARYVGAEQAAAEASEARLAVTKPLTAEEARAAAATEGLALVPSSSNESGFRGVVRKQSGKFQALFNGNGQVRNLGTFATSEEAALWYARHIGPERAAAAAEASQSARVVGWCRYWKLRRRQEAAALTLPPKPRPAGVAAAAAVRAMLGVEALAGHAFAIGSAIEVRDLRQGNRHITQFERVRVYQSDDPRATRVEMAGELAWIDLDEWEVRPAPALPPAPIAFGEAYTGQMPTDAAAYASHLSAAFVGMDCTAYATWTVGGAASTATTPTVPAAAAALPAVRFDRAQLPDELADWLDQVLADHGATGHYMRHVLDSKLYGCDVRTRSRPGMQGLENFTRWGGPLPPVGMRIQIERQQARLLRGAATVIAQVVHQRGLVPWRGGELERRLQLAEWPVGIEPPPPLPPLRLQLDVRPGCTWGNPWAYSIDRNWAIRGSCCTYDVGTFHVVPLIWNTTAGLDQDKVFTIVYTRARWEADTDVRRTHAAATRAAAEASDHPLRLTLARRLRQKGPTKRDRDRSELDLAWALQQYVDQEGACFYTGVTLTLSGLIYTTPFVLSFERLDESLGYTRANTVLIAAEFNSGYKTQMTADLANRFFGPKRERESE